MRHLNPIKSGLALGIVTGLWHLAWTLLVATGIAKPIMDFVLRLHFIEVTYALGPFDPATAAALVALTFGLGFLFGLIFAGIWNWLAGPGMAAAGRAEPVRS